MENQPSTGIQPWQINTIIALLLLIVVTVAQTWHAYQPPPQVLYEYRLGNEPDATLNDTINRMGAEGWELVFARRASIGEFDITTNAKPEFRYEMIFRRPVTKNATLIKGL